MDQYFSHDLLLQQSPHFSSAQIYALKVLQFGAGELQQHLADMATLNPAIEAEQRDLCPLCHRPFEGALGERCSCQRLERAASLDDDDDIGDWSDVAAHGATRMGDDGEDDPLARISGQQEYGAGLLMSLHAMIPAAGARIANYLVGNLDSRGLLPASVIDDAASALCVPPEHVEAVLKKLQTLDPPGIGARTVQEALLLQLRRLREAGQPHPLAEVILRTYFAELAARHFREIAHALNVPPRMIEAELHFIGKVLHPFPAHGYDPDLSGMATGAPPVRPDVVIRRTPRGFGCDIVERRRWEVRVSSSYDQAQQMIKQGRLPVSERERDQVHSAVENAKTLISAMQQRWKTMKRVVDALIVMQQDYLERGEAGLVPLTRKAVGDVLGLHESTVSRATDGKFVQLPDGRTVSFDDFFNESLQVKDAIVALIDQEDPRHPYSDEQLKGLLKTQQMPVARRTVAKYREELKINPSRLRRNRLAPVLSER